MDLQLQALTNEGCAKIFQETESDPKDDRPQLTAALGFVRHGDTLMVTRLDRLARSTQHLLQITDTLQRQNVTLYVMDLQLDSSTAHGQLMLTLLGAIATFERELLLERQVEGIQKAKARGAYKGRKATAMAKSAEVMELLGRGATKVQIAKELKIGIASVYRIVAAKRRVSDISSTQEDKQNRQGLEDGRIDKDGNVADTKFQDSLWDNIPAAVKHKVKMDAVHRAMDLMGYTFEEAAAIYYADYKDYRGDENDKPIAL